MLVGSVVVVAPVALGSAGSLGAPGTLVVVAGIVGAGGVVVVVVVVADMFRSCSNTLQSVVGAAGVAATARLSFVAGGLAGCGDSAEAMPTTATTPARRSAAPQSDRAPNRVFAPCVRLPSDIPLSLLLLGRTPAVEDPRPVPLETARSRKTCPGIVLAAPWRAARSRHRLSNIEPNDRWLGQYDPGEAVQKSAHGSLSMTIAEVGRGAVPHRRPGSPRARRSSAPCRGGRRGCPPRSGRGDVRRHRSQWAPRRAVPRHVSSSSQETAGPCGLCGRPLLGRSWTEPLRRPCWRVT